MHATLFIHPPVLTVQLYYLAEHVSIDGTATSVVVIASQDFGLHAAGLTVASQTHGPSVVAYPHFSLASYEPHVASAVMHAVPAELTVQVFKKWKQLKKLKVPLKSPQVGGSTV